MGFFNSAKKAISGVTKNLGPLSVVSRMYDPLNITGADQSGLLPSMSDALLGKKSKDINPDEITNQVRATQSKGIGELNTALDTPSENIVRQQNALQTSGVLSSAQDARRNAQKLMAQRGLAGSSLGLSANRSIDMDAGNQLSAIRAALPGQIRNQQIQDASTRIGVGGINQGGMNFNTIEGQRSGGILGIAGALAPLAGTVAGGMFGGPVGAMAGGQTGQGLSTVFNSPKNPKTQNYGSYA
ncbi:MAG: hypothetical protein M3P98_03115 [bacterium]|nr:hypothetical protein [bacterium]